MTPDQRAAFDALTPAQQAEAAILAAWPTCVDRRWRRWAAAWLGDHNRKHTATLNAETRVLWSGDHNASWACAAAYYSAGHEFGLTWAIAETHASAIHVLSRVALGAIDLDPILDAVAAGEARRLIPA
jgi:hypothetical protein